MTSRFILLVVTIISNWKNILKNKIKKDRRKEEEK
jgi:hypothetical protein